MSIRDQILQKNDLKEEDLYLKDWDVTVTIRQLCIRDINDIQKLSSKLEKTEKDSIHMLAILYTIYAVVDRTTKERLFTNSDIQALKTKNPECFLKVLKAVNRLGAPEESIEEQAKN